MIRLLILFYCIDADDSSHEINSSFNHVLGEEVNAIDYIVFKCHFI